jgi:hypothetical protein
LLDEKYQLSSFTNKGLIYIASSLFVIVAVSFSWGFTVSTSFFPYHHHSLLFALWVLTLLLFWIIVIWLATRNYTNAPVVLYLRWVGRHVTNFYVFQWLLIGNIGTALYKTQTTSNIVFWFFAITLVASLLVYLWRRLKSTQNHSLA